MVSNAASSEDKTDQVIDAEARIKNTTELRDRLRAMLQETRAVPLRDVIELSANRRACRANWIPIYGLRKMLAAQTDRNGPHRLLRARAGQPPERYRRCATLLTISPSCSSAAWPC
ncbi:DUF4349 domain-containing protein [Cupriavidus basilensis]